MPFLTRGKSIDVVTIGAGRDKAGEIPGADIAQHLARHGPERRTRRVNAGDVDVANVIFCPTRRTACRPDRGRLWPFTVREFVLGGATRGILSSMTVPTLMSH
jgi:hypothetical protein